MSGATVAAEYRMLRRSRPYCPPPKFCPTKLIVAWWKARVAVHSIPSRLIAAALPASASAPKPATHDMIAMFAME